MPTLSGLQPIFMIGAKQLAVARLKEMDEVLEAFERGSFGLY